MVISDDNGVNWRLSKESEIGTLFHLPPLFVNESQAVDLGNNTVLVMSRNEFLLPHKKLVSISYDAGETFTNTKEVNISELVTGVEASIIYSRKDKI